MNHIYGYSLLALFAGVVLPAGRAQTGVADTTPAHTREEFSFLVSAPYSQVFPLFGAHQERKWAAGFEPHFLHPLPAHDQQGMVFTTVQEGIPRVWTNTCFDAASGHVQYVYWIADVMVAVIEIHVNRSVAQQTQVQVVYERTALRPEANQQVLRMAQADANSGPKWAEAINSYLRSADAK